MADIRDIMRSRMTEFTKYVGTLHSAGESTEPLRVRSFQSGTFYVDVRGFGSDIVLVVEGTDNKGESRWVNLDPSDCEYTICEGGNKAFTYVAEIPWVRVRWKSGTATELKVSAHISKTIVGSK